MGLLVAILLLPVVPAFLPRRWAVVGYGVVLLLWGLLWLDLRGEPFGESNYRGFDALLLGGWGLVALIGFCTVVARRPLLALLIRKPRVDPPAGLALWPLPVGALLAVFFMHWLSNRLAGAGPAWLVHGVIASTAVAAGVVLWRFRPRDASLRVLSHLALVMCAGVAAWIGWDVGDSGRWAARADAAADGAPWCALTFAGRDHPRPAEATLDLTRLVSRSGGRGFMDDAYWLVVATPQGPQAKRWRPASGDPSGFETRPVAGAAACTPVPGGNLR
jgi:hypothetical protein